MGHMFRYYLRLKNRNVYGPDATFVLHLEHNATSESFCVLQHMQVHLRFCFGLVLAQFIIYHTTTITVEVRQRMETFCREHCRTKTRGKVYGMIYVQRYT